MKVCLFNYIFKCYYFTFDNIYKHKTFIRIHIRYVTILFCYTSLKIIYLKFFFSHFKFFKIIICQLYIIQNQISSFTYEIQDKEERRVLLVQLVQLQLVQLVPLQVVQLVQLKRV